jgi:alkylhydroperoxidase/carboxymuconolactone decarboxylase family protein YurZ
MELNDRQRQLRERFIDKRGYWNPVWDSVLNTDPEFFEAYLELSDVPWRKGVLEPKVKELIHVAIDASTTHLYLAGLREHVRNALRLGASKEELMEVLELTSVLGIHTCTEGMPILIEELAAAGQDPRSVELNEEQKQLKADFQRERGYWAYFWEGLLLLDPDFLKAYLQFSAVPWRKGALEPKVKELIYAAIDAATTHLYLPGLHQHIANAIGYGATKEEIMEMLELVTSLGMHTCWEGVPILMEELARAPMAGQTTA